MKDWCYQPNKSPLPHWKASWKLFLNLDHAHLLAVSSEIDIIRNKHSAAKGWKSALLSLIYKVHRYITYLMYFCTIYA